MQIACRWPGGMDIAAPINGVMRVVHLDGPAARPRGSFNMSKPPPRSAAAAMHQNMVDTVEIMKKTKDTYTVHDYAVTDVPGDFWMAWSDLNKDFDVIKDKMVFVLQPN